MGRIFISFLLFSLLASTASSGQTTSCDSVYAFVDEMPKFGNSDLDLQNYIAKNLEFGTCGLAEMKLLSWTVDTEGHMIDVNATSLGGKCKQDIVAQLKKFPTWKPGKLKGRPVCVKMNLRMCIKTG